MEAAPGGRSLTRVCRAWSVSLSLMLPSCRFRCVPERASASPHSTRATSRSEWWSLGDRGLL